METERFNETIEGLIFHLEKFEFFTQTKKNSMLETLHELFEESNNRNIRNLVFEYLEPILEKLNSENPESKNGILANLSDSLRYIKTVISHPEHFNSNKIINSEEYYIEKIKELENREMILKETLISNKNNSTNAKQTQEKLDKIEKELKEKKKQLEIKEKEEDAKNNWETKINNTFLKLKDYLDPIEKEKSRLNNLYYAYLSLSIITLSIIIVVECIAIDKITSQSGFPNLNDYLIIYLPIPITGLLMWGFVSQMNRAQRQLIIIANKIHSTNYIQGLLISINNLSPNIEDGITRINNALDKIISNHLNNNFIKNESDLIKEEKKDNLHTDEIIKILKGAKEIYK